MNTKHLLWFLYGCFLFLNNEGLYAQHQNSKIATNTKRAELLYSFTQQIEWDNIEDLRTFNIGVMDDHLVSSALKEMAQKQTFFGKPIKIFDFYDVRSISNISLLYIHEGSHFDIKKILRKVARKRVLVVSENYEYNQSMINIINTDEIFDFEMDVRLMLKENFRISPSLKAQGVRSEAKWQGLFLKAEHYLASERKKNQLQHKILVQQEEFNDEQSKKLASQQEVIAAQVQEIDFGEGRLQLLQESSSLLQQRYKMKSLLLDSLETMIARQKMHMGKQENAILQQQKAIQKQDGFISDQLEQITHQSQILGAQQSEISARKREYFVLFGFFILAVLFGVFIFRNNRVRKRLNTQLRQKNSAIFNKTKELSAQNKEIEQFAYVASHDLQEPLHTISSFIAVLVADYGEKFDDTGKQSLMFIQEASIRMKELITGLLAYSRLGKTMDFDQIDCNELISIIQKDLKKVIMENNALIETTNLPRIKGHEIELRLLFQNLISNAIKFVPAGRSPQIKIDCRQINGAVADGIKTYWEFSIQDNGIGINEEYKDAIFNIFQRLHSKEEFKGSGIGLAHCKKVVEAHKGELWVTSEVGQGSTFYFTIPVAQNEVVTSVDKELVAV